MARLPTVGGDSNAWGGVLNAYLGVGHNASGSTSGALNVFNVKDDAYGAKGDGVTDDTVAIAAAASAANSAGGGVVFFPTGTYITGDQTFYNTVSWLGSGTVTIKLKSGATTGLYMSAVRASGFSVMDNSGKPVQIGANYVYLPQGWDAAWKNAKRNAASARASVVVIGDSIVQGFGATDLMGDSWYAKVRAATLAANNSQLGGDHYGLIYSAASVAQIGGPSTSTFPLVVHGVFNTDWVWFYQAFGWVYFNLTAMTPFVTCTPPYNVTGFEILYADYNPGTWSYNIDGGSNTTVTTTGDGTNAHATIKKVQITGLTSGAHTLNIHSGVSSFSCALIGVTAYVQTSSGLCFANMSLSGMGLVTGLDPANDLATTSGFPPDRLALYQGYQGTTASPTALSGLGFPTQPDLAIIALGCNDVVEGVSKANFRDALDRLVWSLRYGKNDACSLVLMASWTSDGTGASSTTVTNTDFGSAGVPAYRDLRAAMLEVAQAEQCAFVDVHGAFGRFPVTQGWVTSTSNIHPTPAGHTRIATLVNGIL